MMWATVDIEVPGEPVAKERPRTGSGHTYTPKRTKTAERVIANQYQQQWPSWQPDALSTFDVDIAFEVTGTQDLDNLVKTVFDALNKIVWQDDVQITTLTASVRRNAPDPHTWIHIRRIPAPPGTPTATCARCGLIFALPKPTSKAKLCSRSCRA